MRAVHCCTRPRGFAQLSRLMLRPATTPTLSISFSLHTSLLYSLHLFLTWFDRNYTPSSSLSTIQNNTNLFFSFGYCRGKCVISHAWYYSHISHHLVSCFAASIWWMSASVIHHPIWDGATTTSCSMRWRFHPQPSCTKLVVILVWSDHFANTVSSILFVKSQSFSLWYPFVCLH